MRWAAAVMHRILCSLLKNKLMLCCPVLAVSVSVLGKTWGSDWGPYFHSMSLKCFSVFISSLQMCFTLLLLFIQSLQRYGLLFVLVFQPISVRSF